MLLSAVLYASAIGVVVGLVSLLKPVRRLGIRTRGRGALVAGACALALASAAFWPVRVIESAGKRGIDAFIPLYHFGEYHSTVVEAPPERVFEAIRAVTANEIRFFRTLTWIRNPRFGRDHPMGILNPDGDRPILDVALATSFTRLSEQPPREIVVATILPAWPDPPPADFTAFTGRGYAKAVMNFHVVPTAGGSLVSTETRVFATDRGTARRFGAYWRVIYPGSALIRRMWLAAIRRRAEA
jgi:hypothetical protein